MEGHHSKNSINEEKIAYLVQEGKNTNEKFFKYLNEIYEKIKETGICVQRQNITCYFNESIINNLIDCKSYLKLSVENLHIIENEIMRTLFNTSRMHHLLRDFTKYSVSLKYLSWLNYSRQYVLQRFNNISNYNPSEKITEILRDLTIKLELLDTFTCIVHICDRHSIYLRNEYTDQDFNNVISDDPKTHFKVDILNSINNNASLNYIVLFRNSFIKFGINNLSYTNVENLVDIIVESKEIKSKYDGKIKDLIEVNRQLVFNRISDFNENFIMNTTIYNLIFHTNTNATFLKSIFNAYLKNLLKSTNLEANIENIVNKAVFDLTNETANKIIITFNFNSKTNEIWYDIKTSYLIIKDTVLYEEWINNLKSIGIIISMLLYMMHDNYTLYII